MSDRELLELAAKAAGIDVSFIGPLGVYTRKTETKPWNPITDDGDAFRLMVKLGETGFFRLNFGAGAMSAENPAVKPLPILYACEDMEELGGAAATRRAIVRAAAEIGRGIAQQTARADLPEDNYYKTMAEAEEAGRTAAEIGRQMP